MSQPVLTPDPRQVSPQLKTTLCFSLKNREMRNNSKKNLEDILQTVSDRLFPAEIGETKVNLDSRSCDGDTSLHVFIWGNETENALFLIENGIDINAVGDMGETALHVALHQNNTGAITALMNANAKTDIVSEFGKTALDIAREKGISLNKNT